MNEAPSRRRGSASAVPAEASFALYGPDPLEPVRDAVVQLDPEAFVRCFTPDGFLRVPRREGDIEIRGHDELARAGRDLRALVHELSWTPSRRLVSADEVTEEAVVLAHRSQRQSHHRAGRTSHAAAPASPDPLRVPLRAVARIQPDGLISGLTLWLDWAALLDPKGVTSAGGAASALVAVARSRDDRGLRVLQTPPVPAITPPPIQPPTDEPDQDRPRPMSRSAIWWKLHRNTVAGGVMALTAVLLLGWVGLNILAPLSTSNASFSPAPGSSDGNLRGASAEPRPGSGGSGTAGSSGASSSGGSNGSETGDAGGGDSSAPESTTSSSNPQATGAGPDGTGAPVMSSQEPDVRPTVQPGVEITFLSDVLFRVGSFDLSRRSQTRLDHLAGQIRKAEVRGDIQVNGYTDSVGSDTDNMELSADRALAVARALSRRLDGVDVRLQVQAFGESNPRETNRTVDGRRQNRRVIVVLPENP